MPGRKCIIGGMPVPPGLSQKENHLFLGTLREGIRAAGGVPRFRALSCSYPPAHREVFEEGACFRHGTIRVVGREHDPVGPDLKIQVEEGLGKVETTERIVDILPEVVCHRMLESSLRSWTDLCRAGAS